MRPSSTWPAARSTDKTSWCISWGRPQSRLQHPRAAVSLAALPRRRLGTAAAITTAIGPCPTWTAGVRAGVRARRRRRRRPGGTGAAHRAAIARRRAGALATARARAHQRRAPAARRRRAATTGGATSLGATRHGARAHGRTCPPSAAPPTPQPRPVRLAHVSPASVLVQALAHPAAPPWAQPVVVKLQRVLNRGWKAASQRNAITSAGPKNSAPRGVRVRSMQHR